MNDYLVPYETAETEFTEKRSRFIGRVWRVESEAEARSYMGTVKCGEEPRFYLPEYSIAGGKGAKIRLNINHATNVGLKVLEYRPNEQRDPMLEQEITSISQEWFAMIGTAVHSNSLT